MMKTLNEIASELKSCKSALIFCHIHPDGDTLGSAIALKLALDKCGKQCDVVCDGDISDKYYFIPELKKVLKPTQITGVYDCHIAVDVATEGLLGLSWSIFNNCKKRICIDHHISNDRFAPLTFVKDCASTSIHIYELIKIMGCEIDKVIASAVLLGIITDTGNFNHSNVNSEALKIASETVQYGASVHEIVNYLYKSYAKERTQLYLDVMRGMRFYLNDRLAIITILQSDLQKYGLSDTVTEGWVDDLPMSMQCVQVAVSVMHFKKNLYRISIRSKGNANANAIASEFGGGGHKLASGCVISGMYEEVIEKIVRAVDINI